MKLYGPECFLLTKIIKCLILDIGCKARLLPETGLTHRSKYSIARALGRRAQHFLVHFSAVSFNVEWKAVG